MNRMECVLGQLSERTNIAIDDATKADLTKRVWRKDAALWKEDEASQKIIKNSLGWLTVPDEMIGVINELTEFADLIRKRGFQTVMVCGMGDHLYVLRCLPEHLDVNLGFPNFSCLIRPIPMCWPTC